MAESGHVKVALTTNSLTDVDADFVGAKQILFYDVSAEDAVFLDVRQFEPGRLDGQRGPGGGVGCAGLDPTDSQTEEIVTAKVAAVRGCGLLFTRQLSDFVAVRIQAGSTFPVKMEVRREVDHVLAQVQHLLGTTTPRWLRKRLVQPINGVLPDVAVMT